MYRKLVATMVIFLFVLMTCSCDKKTLNVGNDTISKNEQEKNTSIQMDNQLKTGEEETTVLNSAETTTSNPEAGANGTANLPDKKSPSTPSAPSTSTSTPSPKPADPIPPAPYTGITFLAKDIYGNTVTNSIFTQNKLTVVNVWATWCGPCVNELPELQQISQNYSGRGVKVVGILDDYNISEAKTILSNNGISYTVLNGDDYSYELSDFLSGIEYFPTTYFVDSGGNIIDTRVGSNDYSGWASLIDSYLD